MNATINKNYKPEVLLETLFNTNTDNLQSLIDTATQTLIYDILDDIFTLNSKQLDKAKSISINHAIALDKGISSERDQNQITYINGILEGIGMVQNLILKRYNK
jgi:hypothetical protein